MDGLLNIDEFLAGTDPRDSDTDDGGENDFSEVSLGRDPLWIDDDTMSPVTGFALDPLPGSVRIRWTPTPGLLYTLWRRHPTEGWSIVSTELTDSGEFVDGDVANDLTYRYKLFAHDPSSPLASVITAILEVTPREDPFPPNGAVFINDDATATVVRNVTLGFEADIDTVQLRLGQLNDLNDDLQGIPWRPFVASLPWVIPSQDVMAGEVFVIHVQFRDAAGNQSEIVEDDILYLGSAPQVPTTSDWTRAVMTLLLLSIAAFALRREIVERRVCIRGP